jgi:plastocyanin
MKRTLLFAAALLTAACGKPPAEAKPEEKKAAENAAPKSVEYFHVDAATAGTVAGAITFAGAKPARETISMEADEGCQKAHAGKPAYDEAVLIGNHGALANAFVYIQAGLEGKKFEPNTQAVVLDQRGCTFVPRVIGLRPGQTLDLMNGDAVAHNVHPLPVNNREWNQEQAPQAPTVEHRFARPEIMIPVKCNIHAWMHSYIGVVDHPYFAVTGPDGRFQWKNVPPGDYTVAVWHEKLGKQEQQVHVASAASAAVNFTYR